MFLSYYWLFLASTSYCELFVSQGELFDNYSGDYQDFPGEEHVDALDLGQKILLEESDKLDRPRGLSDLHVALFILVGIPLMGLILTLCWCALRRCSNKM